MKGDQFPNSRPLLTAAHGRVCPARVSRPPGRLVGPLVVAAGGLAPITERLDQADPRTGSVRSWQRPREGRGPVPTLTRSYGARSSTDMSQDGYRYPIPGLPILPVPWTASTRQSQSAKTNSKCDVCCTYTVELTYCLRRRNK